MANKIYNKIFYVLFCILVANSASAQKAYSLKECYRIAIENNRKLQNARLFVEAARQTRKEAFTNYFPEISGMGTWFNANHGLARTDISTGNLLPSELGAMLPPELLGMLPASVPVSLLKNGTVGGITATMPVFAGGRIVNGNKLAKVGEEAAGLQQKLTEDEVVFTTSSYFWQVVNLQEKLETIRSIQEMLDRLQKDVETAVEAGMTTRNDLLRVQLQIQDVASSRLKIENAITVCKMQLAQFIGVDTDGFELQYSIEKKHDKPFSMYCDPQQAVMNRAETRLLELNVRASKLKKQISFGEQLPSIGFGGGYLYNDLLGKSNNSGIIYASVSIPISGWWKGSHAYKRHRILERQAVNERVDKIELMAVETKQIWNELVEAYDQLLLAETSIKQATENMRIVENTYKAGTVPLTELLDAQVLFRQSHNQYSDAYSVYCIKELKYKQITANIAREASNKY